MTDKITIERETLERWTETLNQHVHHGKSEWWIALNEMRAALDAQPAKPVASYGEIESACRHAFEIEDGYGDPDSNPQRYRIFRDGFFAARVSAPPAPAALTEEWAADVLGIPRTELSVSEFSTYQRERIACVLTGARAVLAAGDKP